MQDKIAELDYEATLAEKRDKLNSRLQVWSLLVALVGGFGLASLQSGNVSYVVALYPLLAMCIARYAAHSEMVLDRLKAYQFQLEKESGYRGYETFNQSCKQQQTSGGHKAALRDALLLTEGLATGVIVGRLALDSLPLLALLVGVVEVLAMIATFRFLYEPRKNARDHR
jgi:hypothetical protein